MYTYKDLLTGKIRRTRGKFSGWTEPTGLLKTPYAIFQRPKSDLIIPRYLLTKETLTQIG